MCTVIIEMKKKNSLINTVFFTSKTNKNSSTGPKMSFFFLLVFREIDVSFLTYLMLAVPEQQ